MEELLLTFLIGRLEKDLVSRISCGLPKSFLVHM